MRNVLISISAMGLALAVSTPAFAQTTCVWNDSEASFSVVGDGTVTYGAAIRDKISGSEGRAALGAVPPACSGVEAETLRREGFNGATVIPQGTTFAFGLRVPHLVAAPAQPAALAKAGSVGPGEQIDNRLEAVEARDGVGNTAAAEAAARRAEAAADRAETAQRERNSAAQNYRRVLNRPGVTQAQINAAEKALRLANQKLTEARSSASAAAADRVQTGLDRTATGADRTATAADRVQTGQDSAATAANRAWIQAKMWMLWVVAAVAALALLIGVWALLRSRKQAASAPTEVNHNIKLDMSNHPTRDEVKAAVTEVREELHGRIDRVVDDVQLDSDSAAAMNKAAVGDVIKATFTVNDQPTFGLKVTKISAKNFATVDEIGDTPAGQDIGDVIAFVRRAYKGRRNDLDAFKID